MLTKSASNRVTESSQESGGRISTSTGENAKKKKGVLEAKTTEDLLSSSSEEVDSHSDNQNDLVTVDASETHVVMNRDENQRPDFHSPIFNIHIHVPPSNSDSSSTPPTLQPIIHVHFDESTKNHDIGGTSSQKTLSERVVQNFLTMTSTDSRNISLDISGGSDIVNSSKENDCSSPNENDTRQSDDTNTDFESVVQSKNTNLGEKNLQNTNTHSYAKVKKEVNYSEYKPSMQYEENDTIFTRQLRSGATKEVKQLVESDESNMNAPDKSEADKSDEPEVITIDNPFDHNIDQEVITVSDSDTPTEQTNEEIVKNVKKVKKKRRSSKKSSRRRKNSDQSALKSDGTKAYRSGKKGAKELKPERPKTRESIARKCKMPSKEQHLNWVKKVALAKACQLQPNVFTEKELLVKSPAKSKKGQKSKRKSKTSSKSAKSNNEIEEDDSLFSSETSSFSSYHQNKRWSRGVVDLDDGSGAHDSTNRRRDSRGRVSNSKNGRNGEVGYGKKAQRSRIRSRTSSASDSEEETLEDDSLSQSVFTEEESLERLPVDPTKAQDLESRWEALLASGNDNETRQNESSGSGSCKTPETLSYGCQLEPSGLTDKEGSGKSRANSNKAQHSKSKRVSGFPSVSSEETEENDSQGSCETPEDLSNDGLLQTPAVTEQEVERPPVDPIKAQELKDKWVNAFASVNSNSGKAQQNGSLVSSETPKRPSPRQNVGKSLSREAMDLDSSPKAPNKTQGSTDQVSTSKNERDEEICSSASTSCREEILDASNSKTLTLLAEGCNFSEILQKFREKHYKDKVKVFFPNRSKSNDDDDDDDDDDGDDDNNDNDNDNNHIPQDSDGGANESPVAEDEMEDSSEEISIVETIERNSPRERESVGETNVSAIRVSVISYSTRIPLDSENNLNCDVENVSGSGNIERSSDVVDVSESCCDSTLTGDGTTPENNIILQEDNHESHDYVNEFRAIKKKLRSLPDNKLSKPDSEKNDYVQSSSTQLQSHRKESLNNCMDQEPDDIREIEIADHRLNLKRKGSPDPSTRNKISSSAKKMKQSKETKQTEKSSSKANNSNKKVFTEDEYIPLDASGPTKFAVAPLDKVTPYREHAAKDFKGNMLYGNRVKRFNNPKSLDIYKSKQNASKKSSY